MLVTVIFGDDKCGKCQGNGKCETGWKTGEMSICSRCEGNGIDPCPSLYTYEISGAIHVGDRVICPPFPYSASNDNLIGTVYRMGGTGYDGPIKTCRSVPTNEKVR